MAEQFTIPVYETVRFQRIYTVTAETREEAEHLALRGDTDSELTLDLGEVVDRDLR